MKLKEFNLKKKTLEKELLIKKKKLCIFITEKKRTEREKKWFRCTILKVICVIFLTFFKFVQWQKVNSCVNIDRGMNGKYNRLVDRQLEQIVT